MEATLVLERLQELGVEVEAKEDKLRLTPGSLVPPDLLDAVRQNKPAILELLQSRSAGAQPHYQQKYAGKLPTDSELREIEALVQDKGVCLLYSHVLKDYIAFVKDDSYLKDVPPGFVPYSDDELRSLFGGPDSLSSAKLRLIHEAKKLGGRVVDNEAIQ